MANMVNAMHICIPKDEGLNDYANVAFTMFAIYLLISIYIFATYLQGANLCKSTFKRR